MSVIIPDFFYDVSRDVRELSESFTRKHALSYFQYCTVYDDGSHSFLVNRPDFIQARYAGKRPVLSSVSTEQKEMKNYVFLWNETLPEVDTNLAREFGIDHGLCFVRRFPDRYQLIAFAAAPERKEIMSFYLNHREELEGFISDFAEKGQKLIQDADRLRFQLSPEFKDRNEHELYWKQRGAFLPEASGLVLSSREQNCLDYIGDGYTLREIAEFLEISPRTVETYVERLKSKLGVYKKSELVRLVRTQSALEKPHS